MKGIILSGGEGTRLRPLTKVTSKQLLPIYDKPMIYYPLQKLINAGIKEILIIVAPDHCGDYMKVLGSGKEFGEGVRFTYEIQDKPEGLAQAFIIGENFLDDGDDVVMILGDNLFDAELDQAVQTFEGGAKVFAKEVPEEDRTRFGIVEFDEQMKVLSIEEKPSQPKSKYAQTGIYMYDKQVLQAVKEIEPSARGELEITDLNNWFLKRGLLKVEILDGEWIDAGTIESLYQANEWARNQKLNEADQNQQSKAELLEVHVTQHAKLMLNLYQIDPKTFGELSVSTPDMNDLEHLNPLSHDLVVEILKQRSLINNLK